MKLYITQRIALVELYNRVHTTKLVYNSSDNSISNGKKRDKFTVVVYDKLLEEMKKTLRVCVDF